MDLEPPEKLERRIKVRPQEVWQNQPKWISWLASVVVHLVIFSLLLWFWVPAIRGTGGERDRPVGIALVHQSQGSTEYFLDAGAQGDKVTEASKSQDDAQAALKSLASNTSDQAIQLDELLGQFANVDAGSLGKSEGTGDGATGLTGMGDSGVGSGKAKGAKTSTKVFGIEGSGNSFVYVFDRSDSMNGFGGAPLRYAKQEMMQSIGSLTSVNQFQIVFYNESPSIYRGSLSKTKQLIFATDTEKQSAMSYVKAITGSGGTEHLLALKLASNLSPDIIFFLTDAASSEITSSQLAEIVERCQSRRTTIHAIEFGTGPSTDGDHWMERLSEKTGGKYRYLDVTQLDR